MCWADHVGSRKQAVRYRLLSHDERILIQTEEMRIDKQGITSLDGVHKHIMLHSRIQNLKSRYRSFAARILMTNQLKI